jgi:Uma2 family endonuclease
MGTLARTTDEPDLERRHALGADRWDEIWEGELHMSPMPGDEHQDLAADLLAYLKQFWARPLRAKVFPPVNLAMPGAGEDWVNNFRITDLELLTRDRFCIRCGSHWEGAPNVVVEIRSDDDETYEKLKFYLALGVPEVWVIERATSDPELFLRKRGRYVRQKSDAEGWLHSPETNVELRRGPRRKLRIRMADRPRSQRDLPAD